MIRVVELFAGVGGFRVGLEKTSDEFNTVWANQWEPGKKVQHAYGCYVSHFGENSCVNEDIAKVKEEVPSHDLLVGGFPCQDYSVASTGAKGIEGKKGVLWWEIRDIVEAKQPKYILLENVDRLLKSPAKQRGRDFGIILKSLNDLGYSVEWKVINAAEYGCVQRRRRVFIFAAKNTTKYFQSIQQLNKKDIVKKDGFFADIFRGNIKDEKRVNEFNLNSYEDLVDVSNNFDCQFWNSGVCIDGHGVSIDTIPSEEYKPQPLRNIVLDEDIHEKYFLNESQIKKFEYLRGSKKIERTKPNGEKYFYAEGAMSPNDSLDLPSRTMLTSEGSVNRSTHIIKDIKTGRLRKLTPIECERLNGFPDNWTNTMSDNSRYFTMGNALVVPLITKMGEKIREINQEDEY